jgi:hypothetical protein
MNDVETRRERLKELARDLRAALTNGCPVWLVDTVHECITDLERLASFDPRALEVTATIAQAETLIGVCGAASSKSTLAG